LDQDILWNDRKKSQAPDVDHYRFTLCGNHKKISKSKQISTQYPAGQKFSVNAYLLRTKAALDKKRTHLANLIKISFQ